MRRGRGASSQVERYLPLAYFAVALLLVAAVLPTILRSTPPPTDQSAALSPDAPPDPSRQSIIASLQLGSSGTAGSGPGQGNGGPGGGSPPPPPPPPAAVAARACGSGVGNPPRQTFTLYAAPCAAAFNGNNGGATYRGVTSNEVRLGFVECSGNLHTSYTGPTHDASPSDSQVDTTFRVLEQYLNQRYQFYGRHLRFYQTNPQPCQETDFRNAVVTADETYHLFGIDTSHDIAFQEAHRRGLLVGGQVGNADSWFSAHQPTWAFNMSGTELTQLTTELLCKQLVGRSVSFTDPPLRGTPRVFGAILLLDSDTAGDGASGPDDIQRPFRQQCGTQYDKIVTYDFYADSGTGNLSSAMAQMRAAGVTTLACFCDYFTAIATIASATDVSYFPEWIMPGTGLMDRNDNGQTYDPSQWRHALGITATEIPRPEADTDCYKAFREFDKSDTPSEAVCRYLFYPLIQYANGIQLAGPNLTPDRFMSGLLSQPPRAPDPEWSIGGGFSPGHYAYADYVSLVWWDPVATDPETASPGAYRYLLNGKRLRPGEIPTTPLPWFQSGITQAPS